MSTTFDHRSRWFSILNCEGMTWAEWAYAASVVGNDYPDHDTLDLERVSKNRSLRKAWRAGEDPTEWRAVL